jgi:hypothetical protein
VEIIVFPLLPRGFTVLVSMPKSWYFSTRTEIKGVVKMTVRLFATGISINVLGEERSVSGYIKFGVVGFGVISTDDWSELTPGEAHTKTKEIAQKQPGLTVEIQPIPDVSP